jgi:hypothetical protein
MRDAPSDESLPRASKVHWEDRAKGSAGVIRALYWRYGQSERARRAALHLGTRHGYSTDPSLQRAPDQHIARAQRTDTAHHKRHNNLFKESPLAQLALAKISSSNGSPISARAISTPAQQRGRSARTLAQDIRKLHVDVLLAHALLAHARGARVLASARLGVAPRRAGRHAALREAATAPGERGRRQHQCVVVRDERVGGRCGRCG